MERILHEPFEPYREESAWHLARLRGLVIERWPERNLLDFEDPRVQYCGRGYGDNLTDVVTGAVRVSKWRPCDKWHCRKCGPKKAARHLGHILHILLKHRRVWVAIAFPGPELPGVVKRRVNQRARRKGFDLLTIERVDSTLVFVGTGDLRARKEPTQGGWLPSDWTFECLRNLLVAVEVKRVSYGEEWTPEKGDSAPPDDDEDADGADEPNETIRWTGHFDKHCDVLERTAEEALRLTGERPTVRQGRSSASVSLPTGVRPAVFVALLMAEYERTRPGHAEPS